VELLAALDDDRPIQLESIMSDLDAPDGRVFVRLTFSRVDGDRDAERSLLM
jgi:hypothetical protein